MADIQVHPLTLATMPARARRQFDAALAAVHQELIDEVAAHEDRQGPGPQLKTSNGCLEFEVVLRVKITAALDSDNVSQVSLNASVERKSPGFKAHRSGAHMRRSGFYVDGEEDGEVLPFKRAESRVTS